MDTNLTKLLQNVTFDFEPDEGMPCGPHLAYTLPCQNGAASGLNTPYLLKSNEVTLNKQTIADLKAVGLDTTNLEKALSYSNLQRLLDQAVKAKFSECCEDDEGCGYCYTTDFDDSWLVFCCGYGTFAVAYQITQDGVVTLSDTAYPVVTTTSYTEVMGEPLVAGQEPEDDDDLGTDELIDQVEEACGGKAKMLSFISQACGSGSKTVAAMKAATKKEGTDTLTAKDYAYVPDPEKPSTWKLRIDDARHVAAAVAALGKGFMGNKVQIPRKNLASVKAKVAEAYKKFFPDKDVPEVLTKTATKPIKEVLVRESNQPQTKGTSLVTQETETVVVAPAEVVAVDVTKSAEYQAVLKQLEDLQKAADAAKAEADLLKAKELANVTKTYTNLIKTFEVVEEADREAVVKALVADQDNALVGMLVGYLEKAQQKIEAIKQEFVTADAGVVAAVDASATEDLVDVAKAKHEAFKKRLQEMADQNLI